MSAPRVLLVEVLDAAGSDRADALQRRAALRALRARVRVGVMADGDADPAPAGGSEAGVEAWPAGAAGIARLRDAVRDGEDELVLIASAAPGGGAAARALPARAVARWWPTGIAAEGGWGGRIGFGARGRPPLDPPADAGVGPSPPGLAWSSVGARPAGRGRPTLWDGGYLLSPLPLAGEDGSRLLAAFAGLDAAWCGVDLVVLAEPQPSFEREARARGIGTRLHFVGRAAREAEWLWWAHASGAVLAGGGAVAGGLLLRGLRSGCPLLVARGDAPGAAIRGWLERAGGGAPARLDTEGGLREAMTAVLEGGPAARAMAAAGAALAAAHGEERLPGRLASALPALAGAGARGRDDAAA